jgi:hypothetical protein
MRDAKPSVVLLHALYDRAGFHSMAIGYLDLPIAIE